MENVYKPKINLLDLVKKNIDEKENKRKKDTKKKKG